MHFGSHGHPTRLEPSVNVPQEMDFDAALGGAFHDFSIRKIALPAMWRSRSSSSVLF
jgi:hypothetical protein